MKTMSETYGEPNDLMGKHICCSNCGLCVDCGDCNCESERERLMESPYFLFLMIGCFFGMIFNSWGQFFLYGILIFSYEIYQEVTR